MISIIITAYKEPRTIGKAIESVLKNKLPKQYELLVLSADKETIDVVKTYSKKNKKIKIIKDKGIGKPAALNLAFKKAKGEILILTDGDVYIDDKSIPNLLKYLKDKKIGVVSARPVSLNSKKTMLGFWSHLLTDMADLVRKQRRKQSKFIVASGYLYAIRNIIKKIPKDALSDDAVISHMIADKGNKTTYSDKALVYVKYPTTFRDWIKQKKRSTGGYNQLKYMVKNKDRMRSFSEESLGIFKVLSYPKNIKEIFYTLALILARIYLWILIYIDINLRKKEFKKVWVRIETTK